MTAALFVAPATVEEALAALAGDADARVVAGGTDLVVAARDRRQSLPRSLVSIHRVAELGALDLQPGGELRIGALVTHSALESDQLVRERWTALADGSALIGSPAIRNVGTLGGNLANGSPAMDTGAPLSVLGATVAVRSAAGERTLLLDELFVAPRRTALARRELLVSVTVPAPGPHSGSAYVRLEYRRAMDIAVIGAAALVTLDERGAVRLARVALSAVAPTIVRAPRVEAALAGVVPTGERLAAAAAHAAQAARPIGDVRAGLEYRRALVPVIVRRALDAATARARGETVTIPATRRPRGAHPPGRS